MLFLQVRGGVEEVRANRHGCDRFADVWCSPPPCVLPSSTFLIPGIRSHGLGHYMRRNSPFFTPPPAPHRRRVQVTRQVQGVLGFMKPKLEFIDKVKSKFKGGKTEDEKEMNSTLK
jgi:hypothetical protein